jgi:hypothetical protein
MDSHRQTVPNLALEVREQGRHDSLVLEGIDRTGGIDHPAAWFQKLYSGFCNLELNTGTALEDQIDLLIYTTCYRAQMAHHCYYSTQHSYTM